MKSLILLILLLNTAWAQSLKVSEKDCTPTDIRDHYPKLREHFTVPHDQDSTGWCYAYTAADLLTIETGEPVSPVHVSSLFNKKVAKNPVMKLGFDINKKFEEEASFEEIYSGGYVPSALKEAIKAKNLCSYKNLPYYTLYGHDAYSVIKSIEAVKKAYKEDSITEAKACEILDERLGFSMLAVFADRNKVLSSLLHDEMNKAFENLIRENCKDRMVTLPKMKVRELSMPKKSSDRNIGPTHDNQVKNYMKQVNSVLSSGKPLGISYNFNTVTNDTGNHASIVAARRWNNGRCEYKIRNTWGPSCAPYKNNVECVESEGAFWVNDELFFKMAKSLVFIDR